MTKNKKRKLARDAERQYQRDKVWIKQQQNLAVAQNHAFTARLKEIAADSK